MHGNHLEVPQVRNQNSKIVNRYRLTKKHNLIKKQVQSMLKQALNEKEVVEPVDRIQM